MKKNKNNTKKIIIFAAICFVGILALVGAGMRLYGLPVVETKELPTESPAEFSDVEDRQQVKVEESISVAATAEEEAETEDSDGNQGTDGEESGQEIPQMSEESGQEIPQISEEPGQEIPQMSEEADQEIPQMPEKPAPVSGDGQHGQIKDGRIYIDGFGWVEYQGGGAEGVYVDGMSENGNKVGAMD